MKEPFGEDAASIVSQAAGVVLRPVDGDYEFIGDAFDLVLFDSSWDDDYVGWLSRLCISSPEVDSRLNLLFGISKRLGELGHENLIVSDEEVDIDEWLANKS